MDIIMRITIKRNMIKLVVVFGAVVSITVPVLADDLGSSAMNQARQKILQSRQALATDPFRPLYHFSSPKGNLWDPGGFCKWMGKYHLFYIGWGGKGHAVSDDMVHWQDLSPIRELRGLTGQMITTADRAIMTFTNRKGEVKVATSSDPMLQEWEVNTALPPSVLEGCQKPIDSCIWEEDGEFFIGVRKQVWEKGFYHLRGTKPELTVFRSKDLKNLGIRRSAESRGQLHPARGRLRLSRTSCPSVRAGGCCSGSITRAERCTKSVLTTGQNKEQKFVAEYHGRMQYGSVKLGSLHAPSAFSDSAESCFSIFNVSENRPHQGWEGTMALPRHLSLHKDYLTQHTSKKGFRNFFSPLQIKPPAALETLRFNPVEIGAMDLAPTTRS